MSEENPFKRFKNEKEMARNKVQEQLTELGVEIDAMVIKVLTQIRDAYFPKSHVYYKDENKQTWYLGKEGEGYNRGGSYKTMIADVRILLLSDPENYSPYFNSWLSGYGDGHNLDCGVSEAELVNALLQLLKRLW